MSSPLLLALALLSLSPRAHAEILVSWNPEILPDVSSPDHLDQALDLAHFSRLPLFLKQNETGAVKEVATCRQYLRLKAQNFQPAHNIDVAAESAFVSRCRTLEFLAIAKPSRTSFLPRSLGENSVAALPICLGEIGGDSGFWAQNNAQMARGQSLASDPWEKIQAEPRGSLRLTGDGEIRNFTLLASGDVNGDGVEDLLLFSETVYPGGTARLFEAYKMSRTDDGILRLLEQTGKTFDGVTYGCPRTFGANLQSSR